MSKNLRTSIKGALNRSIKPGLLSPAQFRGSTLDLDFAGAKSLKNQIGKKDVVSFTRASSGTYVDGDGLIKTTPVNLFTYSEQFDNSAWTKQASANITPNTITAPDGTTTGDLYSISAVTQRAVDQNISSLTDGNEYVFSIYVKALVDTSVRIRCTPDLTTLGDFPVLVSEGWKRISVQFTKNINRDNIGFFDISGNTGDRFYIWGAQLEQGTTATDYIPTTSAISGAPRFDHDPATGESLGLLIEEARTNEWLGSEDIPGYSNIVGSSVASNNAIAPDGTNTADTVTYSASQTSWSMFYQGNYTGTYTWSGWLKTNDGSTQDIYLSWGPPDAAEVHTFTVTGEWQRFSGVVTPNNENVHLGNHQTLTPPSWNGGVIDVWGVQMELGSFPTSYIPTEGSTVTRAADVAEISGNKFAKTNLLEYSERFDEWNQYNGSLVIPNTDAAPDGTTSADKAVFDGTAGGQITRDFSGLTVGLTYVISMYVKSSSSAASFNLGVFGTGSTPYTTTGDWQRVTHTFTAAATSRPFQILCDDNVEFLIWGAQVEEGDELTEYTPSVESFVSRASSATYVDDTTGLITTTPVNVAVPSNDWSSFWTETDVTLTANSAQGPFGSNDAATLIGSGRINRNGVVQNLQQGTQYTVSLFVKSISATYLAIELRSSSVFSSPYPRVILTSQLVTGEWTRVSAVFTPDIGSGNANARIYITGEAQIYGLQAEQGTTATDYIPTTSTISGAPRYENGELLLEEARTNIFPYSSSPNIYNTLTTSPAPSQGFTAPDGSIDAYQYPVGASDRLQSNRNVAAGQTYTLSFFAKQGAGTELYGANGFASDGDRDPDAPIYNWDTDTLQAGWTKIDYADSWSRFSKSYTSTSGTLFVLYFRISDGVLLWGHQLEEGSYPTSYIPTTTSAVTRAADVSTSALGVDSFYNQSEGTVFAQSRINRVCDAAGTGIVFADDGTANNYLGLFYRGSGATGSAIKTGGIDSLNTSPYGFVPANTTIQQAIAYKAGDSVGAGGGNLTAVNLSASIPNVNRMLIGDFVGNGVPLDGHIKRLAYFNTRLPDANLQNITT